MVYGSAFLFFGLKWLRYSFAMILVIQSQLSKVMGSYKSLNGLFSRVCILSGKSWLILTNTVTNAWSVESHPAWPNCWTRSGRVRYSEIFYWKTCKISWKLILNPIYSIYIYIWVFLLRRSCKNLALDSTFKFTEKVQIIFEGCFNIFIHLESLDRKYLTILVASLIKSTKIMVLGILEIAPAFGITNARSLNPAFLIDATVYMRFGLSKCCLYMCDVTIGQNRITQTPREIILTYKKILNKFVIQT